MSKTYKKKYKTLKNKGQNIKSIKKYKILKTYKKKHKLQNIQQNGGQNVVKNIDVDNKRKGVIDIANETIGNLISSIYNKSRDIGLKLIGLEVINKTPDIDISNSSISLDNSIIDKSKYLGSIADKSLTKTFNNFNKVLNSSIVKSQTKRTAEETAQILTKLLKLFNDTIDKPELREELKEALKNAGEIGLIFTKSLEEPFNEFIDILSKSIEKSSSAISSGAIKVGTDMMAAVPGIGSIIELGKILNDTSKAASSVVEANSEIIEGMSDLIIKTKENFEKVLKEYQDKKIDTLNRINNSMNEFKETDKINVNQINGNQNIESTSILKGGRFKTPKTLKKKVRFEL